jgi:hypothetical protein
MIFARIDNPTTKNILGFECGTRALFDQRHGGDPTWVFVDYPNAVHRSDISDFLKYPTAYHIDANGNLRRI